MSKAYDVHYAALERHFSMATCGGSFVSSSSLKECSSPAFVFSAVALH